MLRDILKLIITGHEHSGTTICKQIFQLSPHLDTGFECGILSSTKGIRAYEKYKPYSAMLMDSWGITPADLKSIISRSGTKDYEAFYYGLRERASNIKNKNVFLIDKTPVYIRNFSKVLRDSQDVPIFVMRKDPRNLIWSLLKRRTIKFERACKRFSDSYCGRNQNLIENNPRIKLIQFEDFIMDPVTYIKDMCERCNLEYNAEDFLAVHDMIDEKKRLSYQLPFRNDKPGLTPKQIQIIEKKFPSFLIDL